MTDNGSPRRIEVQSIVSYQTGEGLVQIRGGDGQLTPAAARDLALNLLSAAEAAETDALVLRFSEGVLGDKRLSAFILGELRQMRGEAPRQNWQTNKETPNATH
jgi:hypothetical protein